MIRAMPSFKVRMARLKRRFCGVGIHSGSGSKAATRVLSTRSAVWTAPAISATCFQSPTPNSTSPMMTSASWVISL